MSWEGITIIFVGLILLFLFSGIPIAAGLGLVGIVTAYIFLGTAGILAYPTWNICVKFILVAIPLFILMGQFILHSGLTSRLYDGATALLGRVPGGLLHSNIGSCAIFAAITGSSVATAVTIGTIAIPEQEKRGYDRKLVLGSLAAGGTLGGIIPPSIGLIIYGAICGQSIGALFIAGVFPGIIIALLFMAYIAVRVKMKPQLAPAFEKMLLKRRVLTIRGMWPVLVIMALVLGGIYLGVVTPTEAAAVGVSAALAFGLVYRRVNWQMMKASLRDTIKATSMIMFILVGAQLLSAIMSMLRLPDSMVGWVISVPAPPLAIMIGIYLFYLFLGCFMDPISMQVITLPITFPIAVSMGFDPIWYGVVVEILMEMGLITPPVGINCYAIHGLQPDRPLSDVFIGIIPFFFMMAVALVIVTAFPEIVTWLPNTMRGG